MKKANNNEPQVLEAYVSPVIEVVEFSFSESIAVSGESISGLVCGEEIPS
ncbi:MAG: hypothetical protein U1C51_03755 [Candidatus Izemoplasmatales bacterium]|jgi:hypothetical protein|nr:hypothetical protein [bacterium]MDZ4196349.1 hypothetical protein [Candidatus Izemoplasmatales bacterium]